MNCKRAQAQIALAVGGDLDDAADRELREHLGGCVECGRHRQQMHDTWALLVDREEDLPDPHDSVWPDLQVKLPNRRELMSRARFNGWTVGLAMTALCLAMVSMWRTANTPEPTLQPEMHAEIPLLPEGWPSQPQLREFGQPQLLPAADGIAPANGAGRPGPAPLQLHFERDPAARFHLWHYGP